MSNAINRHTELQELLERLKLAGMAQSFADLALKAAKEGLSHEVYLHELAKREEALRHERRTERLLRQSGLPLEKTFRTFDLGRLSPTLQLHIERLKKGVFLEQAINVVAKGSPGVGKSHVGAAIGHELILAGHAVLWMPTSSLHDRDEMEVLFTFLAERYEHKSVMITTNLVWSRMGAHFQKSDDHHGGHRPGDPPLRDPGYDGRRQLSRTPGYPPTSLPT